MRITEVKLIKKQRVELEYMEHFDPGPFIQKRSRIILDKAEVSPPNFSSYQLVFSSFP